MQITSLIINNCFGWIPSCHHKCCFYLRHQNLKNDRKIIARHFLNSAASNGKKVFGEVNTSEHALHSKTFLARVESQKEERKGQTDRQRQTDRKTNKQSYRHTKIYRHTNIHQTEMRDR